jgi:hypothetical protein
VLSEPTHSLRFEATPPPRLHRFGVRSSRLPSEEVVLLVTDKIRQIVPVHTERRTALPTLILIRLVFCQVLSDFARQPPPGSSYLPSLSSHSRQHLQVSHCWTVSYDRPDMRTMDVALNASCALGESDETSSCSQSQRIRFVLKRRLHQDSIDSAFGRADYLAKKW